MIGEIQVCIHLYRLFFFKFQSLYRNQVKDLKEEIESKQKQIQDIMGDMKGVDNEK